MIDLDNDHMWCSHAVLKKKFMKYPEKYCIKQFINFSFKKRSLLYLEIFK